MPTSSVVFSPVGNLQQLGDSGAKTVLVVAEKANISPETHAGLLAALAPLSVSAATVAPIVDGNADKVTVHSGSTAVTFATFAHERSRHLGVIRGDAIYDTVLANAGKTGDAVVVVRIAHAGQALPAAVSVARAFPAYSRKTSKKDSADRKVTVHIVCDKDAENINIAEIQQVTEDVRACAAIVDTPPNELHVDSYVEHVKKVVDEKLAKHGVTMTVIRGEELKQKGYGAIYAVGQASEHPPALVILSHTPAQAVKTVAWVGKGIVYDTGGLSIKGSAHMPGMKMDMGGSAGVFYGFVTTVLNGANKNFALHAVLCLAENSVDSKSYRNDDIIVSYAGKSIEINNTDAEGRLALADGVAHATKHLNPDILLDMATLTGAQSFATGFNHAGVLSNSAELESDLVAAGKTSGDLTYPFIYSPELHGVSKYFASEVADMKNTTKERTCVSSAGAGHFIVEHLVPEDKWKEGGAGQYGHIDMAFPAMVGARATGYGVALLYKFALDLAAKL